VTEAVLDASALLAFLRKEPGGERVATALARSCISAVNLAETISKMVEHGKPLDAVTFQIERLRLSVVPFDAEQATIVASLWRGTRVAGLSLGDRACLALGILRKLPVLTADRNWAKAEVGVQVEVIR
jgi:ribonuclease VapC